MDRQQWLKNRKIGSSDAPIVMGVSPWTTRYQLWVQKTQGIERADNANMKYGRDMEETARRKFEEMTGILVPAKNNLKHSSYEWMTANVDGLDFEGKELVEIKCPRGKDHDIALSGKLPDKYFPQCQHQLEVLGLEKMHYFSYRDGEGVILDVYRDDKYIKELVREEEIFWDMIQNNMPPEKELRDMEADLVLEESLLERARIAAHAKEEMDYWEAIYKKEKDFLSEHPISEKMDFGFATLKKVVRKGAIQYNKIPQLFNVDLELYRKAPVEMWVFDQKSEKAI